MRRYEITDEQFERIAPLLSGKPGDPGRNARDNRQFINAVLWIARTGAPWPDLPERFGKYDSVYQRFNRWAKQGRRQAILADNRRRCVGGLNHLTPGRSARWRQSAEGLSAYDGPFRHPGHWAFPGSFFLTKERVVQTVDKGTNFFKDLWVLISNDQWWVVAILNFVLLIPIIIRGGAAVFYPGMIFSGSLFSLKMGIMVGGFILAAVLAAVGYVEGNVPSQRPSTASSGSSPSSRPSAMCC